MLGNWEGISEKWTVGVVGKGWCAFPITLALAGEEEEEVSLLQSLGGGGLDIPHCFSI